MNRVEVNERHRMRLVLRLPPDLAKYAHIWSAHQHLPQNVEAVSRVNLHDILAVHEGALLLRLIVVIVPIQSFPKQVLGHQQHSIEQ